MCLTESKKLIHVETNNIDWIVVMMVRGEPKLMCLLHMAKDIIIECLDG
jgi:hypothetical protein